MNFGMPLLVLGITLNLFAQTHDSEPLVLDAAPRQAQLIDLSSAEGEDIDTPVSLDAIAGDSHLVGSRPWLPPDFSQQDSFLGYAPFTVPKGLETQVRFWVDVYSKYTTDQGVLHDSEYVDLIYDIMDFSPVSFRTDLDAFQKERSRKKLVKEAKKRIEERLKELDQVKDPEKLSLDARKIYDYFQNKKEEIPKKWVELSSKRRLRFQLGQRDRIIQGIYFSGRYLPAFEKLFREAGLPVELTRLVFVESSFNVLARSKVGASGLWQIMRYTGRPYMMINNAIDKRNHPMEATKVAIKLFRNNYNLLKSWPLAVTGWNHGPHGVFRLVKATGSTELSDLFRNRQSRSRLGFASRNFYASFMAILEVESKAKFYFGDVNWSQPLNSESIKLEKPIWYKSLLKWFDGEDQKLQIFNPHINLAARKNQVMIPKGAVVDIPSDKRSMVRSELEASIN
jgi:membrane-bound lytic murein transglycosylase D